MSPSDEENPTPATPQVIRSLVALITGTVLLRAAAGAMGENIQFYFNYISEAAKSADHPLHTIAGAGNVQEISYTLGGIIIGIFFLAEVVGAPLFGVWSDRYGRKLFVIFGPLFGAIAVQLTAMTTIVWLLAFTRIMEGLSTASNAPASLGYIAEITSGSSRLRSRVVGLFEVATIGGMGIGLILGGLLWRQFGRAGIILGVPLTSPAFAINALIYLASLAVLWFGLYEMRESRRPTQVTTARDTWGHYWKLVTHPRILSFAGAWVAINAVLGVFLNHTARLLTDTGNFPDQLLMGRFDSAVTGFIRGGYLAVFVLGILLWSLFFAPLRKTTVMVIGLAGLFLTCLLLFAINHQPTLDSPVALISAMLLVVSILIQSAFTPAALVHLADITEDHTADRGAIMGLYSVFLGVGQFLGTGVGGWFADWRGADGIILITFLLGIVSALTLLGHNYAELHLTVSEPA